MSERKQRGDLAATTTPLRIPRCRTEDHPLRDTLITRPEEAIESTETAFRARTATFTELVDANSLLEFELSYERALANRNTRLAGELDELVGTQVPRRLSASRNKPPQLNPTTDQEANPFRALQARAGNAKIQLRRIITFYTKVLLLSSFDRLRPGIPVRYGRPSRPGFRIAAIPADHVDATDGWSGLLDASLLQIRRSEPVSARSAAWTLSSRNRQPHLGANDKESALCIRCSAFPRNRIPESARSAAWR